MKKIMIVMLCAMAVSAWADIKLDFILSVRKKGCELIKWVENDYENGVMWQQYAKVACKDPVSMPVRIVGLKFLDVTSSHKNYIYTYGLEK